MARIRIGSDDWELRVAGAPPGKDWVDYAHRSVEGLLLRLKVDRMAMVAIRTLCQDLSISGHQLTDDELLERVASSVRNRRVRVFRKATSKDKAKDAAKDKLKADGKAEASPASDPKVARIRIGSEEWEFRAGGPQPDPDAIDLMKVHPWVEPFLQPCKLNAAVMQDFRRLNQFLAIPVSSQPGAQALVTGLPTHRAILPSQIGDDELLQRIATGLRLRQLWGILIQEQEKSGSLPAEPEAAASSAPAKPQQQSSEPEANTFGSGHDAAAQAATLEQAAALGSPFCEECAKRRQAAA